MNEANETQNPDARFGVFTRTWWTPNPNRPGGREPHAGRKHYLAHGLTYASARWLAADWNKHHHPGKYSRKAEVTCESGCD